MRSRLPYVIVLALILSACATPPLAIPAATPPQAAGATVALPAVDAIRNWETYQAPDAGLTFAYPPGSAREQVSTELPWFRLITPAADYPDGNVIHLGFSPYELAEGMSLETWAPMTYAVGEMPREVVSTRWVDLGQAEDAARRGLAVEVRSLDGGAQAVYLAHGNLVLEIIGPNTEAMRRLLPQVAATVRFDADAPTNLTVLTGRASGDPTLEEVNQERMAGLLATPELDIVARDATAAAQITPGPAATYGPEMQTIEAAYYQSLETATAVAQQTPPTPVPSSTATATPIPAERAGFALYRGSSAYAEQPQFELTYETAQWTLESDETAMTSSLKNRQLPGCELDLRAGGIGIGGPIVVDWPQLGGFEWRRTAVLNAAMTSYLLELDPRYFLLVARYPASGDQGTTTACRAAVEAVLDTFEIVE